MTRAYGFTRVIYSYTQIFMKWYVWRPARVMLCDCYDKWYDMCIIWIDTFKDMISYDMVMLHMNDIWYD